MEVSETLNSTAETYNSLDRTEGASTRPKPSRRHRRRRRADGLSNSPLNRQQKHGGPISPSDQLLTASAISDPGTSEQANPHHPSQFQGRRKLPNNPESDARFESAGGNSTQLNVPTKDVSRRRANFCGSLTKPDAEHPVKPLDQGEKQKRKAKGKHWLPQGDDLTSTLAREMSTPPYPDCLICFSPIRPDHAIWSCSPSNPIVVSNEAQVREYCWTSFHIKCIRSWAEKKVKEVADAWRARGELDRKGDWRCPGCQAKREVLPSGYWCVFISYSAVLYFKSKQIIQVLLSFSG